MSALSQIEEGSELLLDFNKMRTAVEQCSSIIPAIAQDEKTKEVLMLGYVNQEALSLAIKKEVAVFWSTSRNELWIKGSTSGEYLDLKDVRVNCEQNSILYIVSLRSTGACHTKKSDSTARFSCYYRRLFNSELKFIEDPKNKE